MRSGRRRNVRVSGRQQFELHLVKGKILRGRKGKGLKREGRTGRTNAKLEGQLHMANVFSALVHAWTNRRTVITSIQHCARSSLRGRVHIRRAGPVFALDEFLLTKQLSNSIAHFVEYSIAEV